MAIVYQHTTKDTGELFYIGVGADSSRAHSKKNRNPYWHHVVKKHGRIVTITHSGITYEEAYAIEVYLVEFWGKRIDGTGILVNLADGGKGGMKGYKFTEEQLRKRRETTGNYRHNKDPEIIAKRVENTDYSFTRDPQVIAKRRANYPVEDVRLKRIGVKHLTPAGIKRLSDSKKVPITQYSKSGVFIQKWTSAIDASVVLKIDNSSINKCCKGRLKTAGGFVWKFSNITSVAA